jgi:glycosyltransferase involved in cell wall biosynthesis
MLSVIVPVRNGEHFLPASLTALHASQLPSNRWELIVVDDSSQDLSPNVAAQYTNKVVRLAGGARGAAFARNRGAEVARGDILVFVDADVCVHSDVLDRIDSILESNPDTTAVFGAYDLSPAAKGLVSQYRNLLHHYVHLRDAGKAVTFWAGCGAIRTEVFNRCGGFDEERGREALEDVELGYRMAALGYEILLCPEIQGTHLKRWTLWNMIVTDVWHRGMPWMRLLMSGKMRNTATLNIRASEQACTLLLLLGTLALLLWLWGSNPFWLAIAVLTLGTVLVLNGPLLSWFARHRGWWFAARTIPLRLLYYSLNAVSVWLALLFYAFGSRRKTDPPSFVAGRAVP